MANQLHQRARAVLAKARAALGPRLTGLTDLLLDNLPELQGVAQARALLAELGEQEPPRDLGTTKDGRPILARACAEDNSGVVFERDGQYVAAFSYPVAEQVRPERAHVPPHQRTEADYEPVYEELYPTQAEAVQALRDGTGYTRFSEHGPD